MPLADHSHPAKSRYELDPLARNPYREAELLRGLGKIAPAVIPTKEGPIPVGVITDYATASAVLTDDRFSKDSRYWRDLQDGTVSPNAPLVPPLTAPSMLTTDPPEHTRLRQFATKAFSHRSVDSLAAFIENIVDRLLDDLEATAPGQQVDLRAAFASPLPTEVLFHILGVPDDDRRDRWRELFLLQINSVATAEMIESAGVTISRELTELIADKREHPGNDLITALIQASDEDTLFTPAEVIGTASVLILAGYETTINLISNGICALAEHADQLELVRSSQATWTDVVEEVLRWDPPILTAGGHYPRADLEIGGQALHKGDLVLYSPIAIGRDPKWYGEDAGRFRVTRRYTPGGNKAHLCFGHGIHHCLGAALARLEARVALQKLFTRFPELSLAVPFDQLRRNPTIAANSLSSVPAIPHPVPCADTHTAA